MNEHNGSGIALVTGASSGIGATYADRLARRGFDLLLVARDEARLDAVATRLRRETGVHVEVLGADLTVASDLERVAHRLRSDEAISMLVNNAGMSAKGPLAGADHRALEAMIGLNVLAVTHLAGAAATAFASRGTGTIVNIASVLALAPELFNGVYSATKAYVLNLTLAMQQELGRQGVRVQAVLPGATRTEIWERSGTDIASLPQDMLMDVDEMVDAALAGLDLGEAVTIPSLPDVGEWNAYSAMRLNLAPRLSLRHAAARYATGAAALHADAA
ncbi:SDR family oxidoreductase [Azoarcus sp. KH32C]|uniref:SDR family NAD(P)-dependent oxidoreductase n=1 Tax=Azoarcus sp. KH32C TaxID=748247 RepID=UPI0002386122|nr:SDR family oxidoreductase [Azoarcus sp. KH32C]BAL24044.1 short chain dehydrogenase/reductase family oxidoreductase [Azoarcus sp. KH32C]